MTRLRGALLLLVAAPLAAQADDDTKAPEEFVPGANWVNEPTYEVKAHQYTTTTTESRDGLFADFGWAVSAGGGVSGFTDNSARGTAQDGGAWDVRATFGTRSPLAAEVSYLGSMQQIDALGLDNALLVGNGVQANVRLNLTTSAALQPFLFAGAAWRHYSLTNVDTNTSDIDSSDNVLEVPVGAGLAYRYRGFLLDARGEYRPATNNDLMPSFTQDRDFESDNRADLHRWGVNANIGYEF